MYVIYYYYYSFFVIMLPFLCSSVYFLGILRVISLVASVYFNCNWIEQQQLYNQVSNLEFYNNVHM